MTKNIKNFFLFILILQRLQFSTQVQSLSRETALDYSGRYKPNQLNSIKYVVSIRTAKPTAHFGDNHYCCGVIVAARTVVTAAHCVVNYRGIKTRPRRIKVVAGNLDRLRSSQNTVEIGVDKVIPHEHYVRHEKNDIAVLRLKSPLPDSNEAIRIIALGRNRVADNKNCSVCGWGQLFLKGPYSRWAIVTYLQVLSNKECRSIYPTFFRNGMICAADKNDSEKSVCRGYSGSPLICDNVLHGIVSWNNNCGEENTPSVFTEISKYSDWITQHSGVQEMQAISEIKLCITVILAFVLQKYCVRTSFL